MKEKNITIEEWGSAAMTLVREATGQAGPQDRVTENASHSNVIKVLLLL